MSEIHSSPVTGTHSPGMSPDQVIFDAIVAATSDSLFLACGGCIFAFWAMLKATRPHWH